MKLIPSEDLYLPVWCPTHSGPKPAVAEEGLWDPRRVDAGGHCLPAHLQPEAGVSLAGWSMWL